MWFASRPMKIVAFPLPNRETPKRVVDFPLVRDTFRNKIMEIVHFVTCFFICLHFLFLHYFMFLHLCHFSIFFHSSFSFFFHEYFDIFHFFIFFHVLSFSFVFFVFVGCSKSDFFRASISLRFLPTVLM